ncbi:MAG: DUF2332 domain-containing protein [Fimbriimonas sp.]
MDLARVAAHFERVSTVEAVESSPLYADFARRAMASPEILEVARHARPNQPPAYLFFGAVQFLLSQEGSPFDPQDSPERTWQRLLDVVHRRRPEVLDLLATKMVQTNEVRRSILLFTAFAYLSRPFPNRPIALVEIGTSAGFNLLFDRYGYRFNGGDPFGHLDSPVQIDTELRGELVPPTTLARTPIVSRTGVDLNPLDPNRQEDADWLRALIWPEHTERRQLLDAALLVRRAERVGTITGNAVDLLPDLLEEIPSDIVPFVFHTYVAYQMPAESKERLLREIDRQGRRRDVVHLHNGIVGDLHATWYRSGERTDVSIANNDPHARWVEWLAPSL